MVPIHHIHHRLLNRGGLVIHVLRRVVPRGVVNIAQVVSLIQVGGRLLRVILQCSLIIGHIHDGRALLHPLIDFHHLHFLLLGFDLVLAFGRVVSWPMLDEGRSLVAIPRRCGAGHLKAIYGLGSVESLVRILQLWPLLQFAVQRRLLLHALLGELARCRLFPLARDLPLRRPFI